MKDRKVTIKRVTLPFHPSPCVDCIFSHNDGDTCDDEERISNPNNPLFCGEQNDNVRRIWVLDLK